ncbi:2-amino-3,7-dideoxy-D-threo-hept-6-ulosonate synthase [Pseudodesulfovibrio profundus]|uniref:2-amino-3,7-dideoxy-D-threo-hept-6-ulosonate synthase n=1 Tax=Pseudodesulfovibrio profundus TaxID=57320 RepID=A0A2C8FC63_9BACT|nr:2-amino-3,7-dideoxy-D-threo-hept-6-ulosonate synthase [Pseudodesulfovibrio profundus]MBC15656.1 fructose-bisphosphate aldolase [Desulfovibrio sp.]SOB59760.1 2-amino-3,7-dideoxy-D-threo-hept-6-ulosonate synthase [Pseudodesulfovibrio profundus]|tara:strand:+ start:100 stop:900 length:801 start_codon:yes stop_codon:yes gene_type:complete
MHIGKAIRLERIVNRNTGKTIIVPMDHGVTVGPIDGLVDMREAVGKVVDGGANAVIEHKGLVRCGHRAEGKDIGLIVHLSASTTLSPFPNAKSLVASVEDAIRLGADAISIHCNLGDETESAMLADFGKIAADASNWGMPLLSMVYARGPKVGNEYDPNIVAHCARVGTELGADIIKVNYTGDPETFSKVCDACCVPVVIAGGPKLDSTESFLQMVHDSLEAGGAGLSVGRNVFQHENPTRLVEALNMIVHHDESVEKALEHINQQ